MSLTWPGTTAGASPTVRAGWWSQVAPAPAPPDVPDDGLHVAGGVDGPTAVAALAYDLPDGAIVTTLAISLAGVSPRAGDLRACAIPLDAAGFAPAQNGSWSERPPYDCDAGSATVTIDGEIATFAVGALQQGRVLAVALVPGATDRTSIDHPTAESLGLVLEHAPTPASSEGPVAAPEPPAASAARPAAATPVSRAAFRAPGSAVSTPRQVAVDDRGDPTAASSASGAATAAEPVPATTTPWRTRAGGALGFALLLSALLFYSQGRGLLGARVGST